MTKHDAMVDYFSGIIDELVSKDITFNFSGSNPDSIGFVTDYSDKVIKKYIRRGSKKEYGFAIVITRSYSSEDDDLNLSSMNFCQNITDWIDKQDVIKNYPVFENCDILSIESLQNMPNLSDVDMEHGIARYMCQCRLTYFEKEVK